MERMVFMHNRLTLGYMTDKALKSVSHEDANALTHINLAFGVIRDGLLDMSRLPNIREIDRIRDYNATLKIVLSIGGWGAGGFSPMVGREDRRAAFIESCAKAVQTYGLDGIDIDWEYPCLDWAGIESAPQDKENFSLLLEGLRGALGAHKIVSIAAGAGHYFVENTQMERVAKACSYVQLMTYDLRSGFEREAGHHTNLFPTPGDRLNGSVQASVEDFAAAGVPKDKIVIGAAFYSRRWDGVPDVNHGLFQTAATTGQHGPGYTDLYDEYINKNGFVRYWDDAAKAPYLFNGSTFISYDDPESIRLKCAYLKKEGLLGIMYWEHSCDPSRRLLTAMADAMLHT